MNKLKRFLRKGSFRTRATCVGGVTVEILHERTPDERNF